MKLSVEEFAEKLVMLFPEKKQALDRHYADHNELLGHIFFAAEISEPLISLLSTKGDRALISRYCSFIADMQLNGDEAVVNILEATILERLSDDKNVWDSFGKFIPNDLIRYINTVVIAENAAMQQVSKLKYHK